MSFQGTPPSSFYLETLDLEPTLVPPPVNFKPYLPNRVQEVRDMHESVPLTPEYINVYTKNSVHVQVPSRLSQNWHIDAVSSPETPLHSLSVTPSTARERTSRNPFDGAGLDDDENLDNLGVNNPYYTSIRSPISILKPRQYKVETKKRRKRRAVVMERATDRIYTPLKGNRVRDFMPAIPWPYSGVTGSGELSLQAAPQSDERSDQQFIEGQEVIRFATGEAPDPWFPLAINPETGLWTPFIVTGTFNGETMIAFVELEQLEHWLAATSRAPPGQAIIVEATSVPFQESMLPRMSCCY